jgi:hypothetical protein
MTEDREKQKRKRLLLKQLVENPCMAELIAECESKVETMEKAHRGKSYEDGRDLYVEAEGARKMLAFLKGKVSNAIR